MLAARTITVSSNSAGREIYDEMTISYFEGTYDEFIETNHLHDEFDINVDIVITEKQIISLEDKNERKRTQSDT